MPSSPPVTEGLSVWLCSDTNVDLRPDNSLVSWAAADSLGVRAVSIGSSRPQWLASEINGYPVIRFNGTQGLFLETGLIAQDSFTLIAIGRATGSIPAGSPGLSGQKMLFYQDGSSDLTHASVSLGVNAVGVYEFGGSDYPDGFNNADGACFCPLVVRYEARSFQVYLCGSQILSDGSAPAQPVDAPHGIGGTGGAEGGFEGDIAEVLIFNRALSDWERQLVEQYLQSKYGCGSSSSSDSSSSEESSWSSEESSWWSSEESSMVSSWESSSESSWSSEESSSSESSSSSSEWWSSEWSSSEESSSSSCSCEMPSDPVPVTEGLVAWQRSDLNVSTGANNEVGPWGAACACLPNAVNATSSAPVLVPQAFGVWPGVQFASTDGLRLDSAELGANSFTLVFVANATGWLPPGGYGPEGQRLLAAQDTATQPVVCANVALGYNHAAIFEFGGTSEYPRLEVSLGSGLLLPLVVRYENKELSIYGNGVLLATSPVQPGYDIWIPRLLGADGAVVTSGFQGQVAEWLFYNRALSDYERGLVEQYVMTRYQMESSSSSFSEESSSSSSEESSWSSSEESSWSSEESSMESSWESSMESSWESSMESSGETSSGTSGYVPDPVPVTSGLVAWQRSDLHVQKDFNNQVTEWGGADGVLPAALRATFNGPVEQWNVFGNQPALLFTGAEGLRLQAGNLGSNSFTLFVVGCPAGQAWDQGVLLGSDNQTGAVAQISASQAQVQVSEPGGSGGVRLQATTFGCLCPVSVVYQNKQARLYFLGSLEAYSTSTPPYDILIPKLIGGPGAGGFFGSVAEVLMYNRALSDGERQQVEAYLMGRYQCLPSITSSEESSGEPPSSSSSSSSDDDSSSSSSSSSSQSESGEGDSSDSSDSTSSESSNALHFLPAEEYLTNPHASDYTTIDVYYVNSTGQTVGSVNLAGAGLAAASVNENVSSPEYPYTIVSWDQNKLTLKAAMDVGILGIALASVGFEFKDNEGELISTASLGLEVQQTLKNALTIAGDKITFTIAESLGTKTAEWALSYPFDEQEVAFDTIEAKVSSVLSTESGTIRASMYGSYIEKVNALPGSQNVSVKLGGVASYTLIKADVTQTTVLSVTGNAGITWTPTSNNSAQSVLGLGMILGNINIEDRKLDGNKWKLGVKFESQNNVGGGTNAIQNQNRIEVEANIGF